MATRHRRPQTWPAIAVALLVHALILLPLDGFGLLSLGRSTTARVGKPVVADVEIVTTCTGDVALGAAARYALCAAPWAGDFDQCLDEAFTNMWMDLSSCSAGSDPGVAVAMLEPRVLDKLEAIDPEKLIDESQPPPPPPEPAKPLQATTPPPPPPPVQGQIVETVKPNHEEEPQNTRLLSEYNIKVDKQTVARGSAKEPMVAKSKPEELTVKDKPKDEPPAVAKPSEPDRKPAKRADHAPDAPGTLSMRNPGAPTPADQTQDPRSKGSPTGARGPSIADGFMPRRGDGAIEQDRHERQEIPRGGNNGGGGGAPPNLVPSKEMLERIAGGGNVDHLDDVDESDVTGISTKRDIYASFFNRVKRQVAQNWDPSSVWRRVDPTGAVNGFKSRITEVRVTLDLHGAIEKIIVTSPCGVGDLDEEGVRAFKASGPFPNTPEGLAGKDGLATFAFSFYFQIGETHTSWRVIRSM